MFRVGNFACRLEILLRENATEGRKKAVTVQLRLQEQVRRASIAMSLLWRRIGIEML
jgi:hypothetical protein